jgi:ubiquinone biosynthesis protein COQ4
MTGTTPTTSTPRSGRIQPLRALRAVRRLIADPEETAHVFDILDALRGRNTERGLARLARVRPDLVAERPEMLDLLNERVALAELPAGSLGREYLAFCEREGISADGLVEASDAIRSRRGDEALAWFERRGRDSHDLWHVVTGYGTNTLGEVCVVSFSCAQTGNLGLGLIALAGALKHAEELGWRASFGAAAQAFRAGRRAAWLPAMDWRTLLPLPLDEVRARLGMPEPTSYRAALEDWAPQAA